MVGERPGGVNVFGGGLGLYNVNHKLIGGIGLSGDTSCADHNVAWRVRNNLALDNLAGVGGVGPSLTHADGIVFDIETGASAGGFGRPELRATTSTPLPPMATARPTRRPCRRWITKLSRRYPSTRGVLG